MEPQNMEKRRILVIEDEPVIGTVCRRVLGGRGFDVDIVTGSKTAASSMHDRRYDLCILDWRVPGMDGIQLYRLLNTGDPESPENTIPATGDAVSGKPGPPPDGPEKVYLQKPFTPGELIAAVELALN